MTCVLVLLALCAAPAVGAVSALWIGWFGRHLPGDLAKKMITASCFTIVALIYALGICLYLLLT